MSDFCMIISNIQQGNNTQDVTYIVPKEGKRISSTPPSSF